MVDVIREKCSVTGKVIIGIGLDDFQKKWAEHIASLKVEEPKLEEIKTEPKIKKETKKPITKKKKK